MRTPVHSVVVVEEDGAPAGAGAHAFANAALKPLKEPAGAGGIGYKTGVKDEA